MAAKDLTKRTKFAFTKKQLKGMFDEAISVNPYEKKNGHEILRTSLIAKNCLPPMCTTRLVFGVQQSCACDQDSTLSDLFVLSK